MGKGGSPEADSALFVPDSVLRGTAHATLSCGDCHPEHARGYPHSASGTAVPCARCHERAGADWAASVHAAGTARGGGAPTCVRCHGAHRVYPASVRESPTHPLNVARLCGSCHGDPRVVGTYFSGPEEAVAREAVARYYETVHGTALTRAGLTVTATCNDCHGAHRVLPADSPQSSLHRTAVAATCGACHEGVRETFEESSHGAALAAGTRATDGRPAPVCTDCHRAHEIVRTDEPVWYRGVVEECGECHARVYDTYFETYHGKASRLGSGLVARCADCHTAHAMRAASDLRSSVHPANLVRTCARCHPRANWNFVQYRPHGDHRDRVRYPELFWAWAFMTALLVGVFGFFGLHTLLWLARLATDRVLRAFRRLGAPSSPAATSGSPDRPASAGPGPREGGAGSPWTRSVSAADRGGGPYLRRFSPLERFLHGTVIVSFFGLVLTGLPLHFSYAPWARVVMAAVGGVGAAGFVHRVCAAITFGYFFTHLASVALRWRRARDRRGFFTGPDSMVPRLQDLRDVRDMFRWFLRLGPRPRFDRFSYMEKFDYWAVFWGVAIIGGSGLLLWFPEFFSRFLPGWVFNVATIVHGDEALLAAGFIFTIHFFNVHFRPEKFPIDLVVWTGRATAEYMREEHPLEYERWVREGRLAEKVVPPPSRAAYLWGLALGFAALALGVFLIVLVIWTVLG